MIFLIVSYSTLFKEVRQMNKAMFCNYIQQLIKGKAGHINV